MNKFLLLFICLLPFQAQSQNPEMLAETWYLKYLIINGEQLFVPLNENFIFNFSEANGDYSAEANGVENVFSGTLNFNPNDTFTFTDVAITLLGCDLPNCYYENHYFYDFLTSQNLDVKTFQYDYNSYSQGLKSLQLTNTDAGYISAYFGNEPVVPDPALFQTWYLYETTADLVPPNPITPTKAIQVTLNPDLTFTALDSNCIEIEGAFDYYEDFVSGFFLQLTEYIENTENCTPPYGRSLNFGDELTPLTAEVAGGASTNFFYYDTAPGFGWYYRNDLLSINEQTLNEIVILPNPASQTLGILNSVLPLKEVSVIDFQGKTIKTLNEGFENIDVSNLSNGVYFLKISSENTQTIKKFIKK